MGHGQPPRPRTVPRLNNKPGLIGMDDWNIRNMERIAGGDPENKIHKLLEFAGKTRDIADPWYTGNFDATYEDVMEGCLGLLSSLV